MKLLSVLLSLACLAPAVLGAEDSCGGTFRGFQYTITSPNYPGNYPSRTECTYRLEGEPTAKCAQQFHLQFLDFDLKATEGCRGDYLQVGDRNVYCGNTLGLRKFTGSNNTLILTFHSDQTGRTAKGFKILVSALPCSLKLSPLKNPPLKSFPSEGRSSLQAREIGSGTAYRRGIRGGGGGGEVDNSATRLNLLTSDVGPSIRRPQTANPPVNSEPVPRITSYLFLPPREDGANVTVHYDLGSALDDKDSRDAAPPPSNDLLPPSANAVSASNALDKKLGGVPPRSYGELGALDYDAAPQSSDYDKGGQVLLSPTGGSFDRANIGSRYGSSGSLVYDPKHGLVGGSSYPTGGYYPPNAGYPGTNYPNYQQEYPGGLGSDYPVGSYAPNGAGYYPGYDPASPNYNPSIGGGFIGSGGGLIGGGECCRLPKSSRFSIVSPGFPTSAIAPGGSGGFYCRYAIVKSSPYVCRLRLNLRFFNFGADDPYCSLGYVDIDGQRLCGCRSGQSLQLLFGDYIAKTISVFSAGASRSRPAGFLIDVAQESCRQPGLPGYDPPGYDPPVHYPPGYNPGYLRRRSADNASDIAPSPPDPNPHIRERRDVGYSYARPSAPFPGRDGEFLAGPTQERFFGGSGSCQDRLLLDWAFASKEALLRGARCSTTGYGFGARRARSFGGDDGDEEACEEVSGTRGEIKSPLYPDAYPGNARKCYRFNRAANVCALELHVRDFDLESSRDCAKDYLSFGPERKKHCGESLKDATTLFDLTHASSLEVDFASDESGAGRGFDIVFAQLPCEPNVR